MRFQEPRYHQSDTNVIRDLANRFNFLKQRSPDDFVPDVLQCMEFAASVEHRQKWFNWKPGRYDVRVDPTSSQKYDLSGANFSFELREDQITTLSGNIPLLRDDMVNIVSSNLPAFSASPFAWKWVNVDLFDIRN